MTTMKRPLPGEEEIKPLLYGYIAKRSITNTPAEQEAEDYLYQYFAEIPYFKEHPELFGAERIVEDSRGRKVVWAMYKGETDDTVVCIHHHDVVSVEDFKRLKEYAFSPDELEEKLKEIADTLSEEDRADLMSGEWLFGRGGCDMKAGGSIQAALLKHYTETKGIKGSMIVLSVPDEENLSDGMSRGVVLLKELQDKYHLNYKLMINSEPHQRIRPENGIFSFGTVGKVMPFVYVRGVLSHAGRVFEGLNPVNIMSEIVRRTEINYDFSDSVGNEAAPPPTWLYLRENKVGYDVSMPLTMMGALSVLTFRKTPIEIMQLLKGICEEAFAQVIDDMNRNYKPFAEVKQLKEKTLPWKVKVSEFGELLEEAKASCGERFEQAYDKEIRKIAEEIRDGKESLLMGSFRLTDMVYEYIDDLSPRVVIGIAPPYYPSRSNVIWAEDKPEVKTLYSDLNTFAQETLGRFYEREDFYTGICDLSYSSLENAEQIEDILRANMPMFGHQYKLPLREVEQISMPCVNIGPWGKAFHKLCERVLKKDVYVETPQILDFAIRRAIGENEE